MALTSLSLTALGLSPISGIANAETLKENPKNETIQAVTVVPMFAPKIITNSN